MDIKQVMGTFDAYQIKVVKAAVYTSFVAGLLFGVVIGLVL